MIKDKDYVIYIDCIIENKSLVGRINGTLLTCSSLKVDVNQNADDVLLHG